MNGTELKQLLNTYILVKGQIRFVYKGETNLKPIRVSSFQDFKHKNIFHL